MHASRSTPSGWRYFPLAVIAALGVVVAVNAFMITTALESFPGQAGGNGFDLSNHYDTVLRRADREAALGWRVDASLHNGRPVLRVLDRDAHPLPGARVTAEAQRPVGPESDQRFAFTTTGDGTYVASAALRGPGQWDLLVTVQSAGQVWHANKRLFLP